MVLPAETERRVKRKALDISQDHLRKVLDITRIIPQMIGCFMKNDQERASKYFSMIQVKEDEVDEALPDDKKRKKRKARIVEYDPESGEMIVKRRRKRQQDQWEEGEF